MRVDTASMTDRVYDALRSRILGGALPYGERLHQEDLAEELGVSRTPLREAIGRLAADGLVELLPNRGARVAGVSPDDMRAAYEARLVTEPAAARLAAERGAAMDAARAAVAALRDATADVLGAFEANRAFHLAVVRAAGNPFLLRFGEMLWATRLGGAVYDRQHRLAELVAIDADAHEEIADAIAAGDGPGAERLMREHIGDAMGLLLRELQDEREG